MKRNTILKQKGRGGEMFKVIFHNSLWWVTMATNDLTELASNSIYTAKTSTLFECAKGNLVN